MPWWVGQTFLGLRSCRKSPHMVDGGPQTPELCSAVPGGRSSWNSRAQQRRSYFISGSLGSWIPLNLDKEEQSSDRLVVAAAFVA